MVVLPLSSSQVRIICSAAAPLQSLFQVKQDSAERQENRVLMDDLDLSQVHDFNMVSLL